MFRKSALALLSAGLLGAGLLAALAQDAPARNAVNDLVVDRSANRGRKAVVAFERWNAAALANPVLRQAIEIAGGDAGASRLHQLRQDRRRNAAAAAHRLNLPRGL